MYLFHFDCGTSNTRGYLLKEGKVIGTHKQNIGSKDVSIHNDKFLLIRCMKEIYDMVLQQKKISGQDISRIYASGMITSPYGLMDIPHAVTPISRKMMKDAIRVYKEDIIFKREIYLVPGLKTTSKKGTLENIDQINNVRGEEIEVIGICNHIPEEWKPSKYIVILPGSHTHTVLLEGETILDIYSTFSGELFHAVSTSTILSGSIKVDENLDNPIDTKLVRMGCENLMKYGLARAIYIVHGMKIFDVGDNHKRRDTLSGLINGAVVQSLALNLQNNWKDVRHLAVYGHEDILNIYREAIRVFIPDLSEKAIYLNRSQFRACTEGLISIINS